MSLGSEALHIGRQAFLWERLLRLRESSAPSNFDIVVGKLDIPGHIDYLREIYPDIIFDPLVVKQEGGTEYNLYFYFGNRLRKARGVHVQMTEHQDRESELHVFFTHRGSREFKRGWNELIAPRKPLIDKITNARLLTTEVPFNPETKQILPPAV